MTPRILRTEQVEQVSQFAVRGPIFDLTGDPAVERDACRYLDDGVMIIENGRIKDVAAADQCLSSISASMVVHEYPDCLICPGFIDAHIHYAQTRIVGCPATGLLEWLETHTFPEELRFESEDYSRQVAQEFLDTLLCNGTTSALVYPTVHAVSAEQFFQQAHGLNMRMIAGKVLMDRNAPPGLCDGDDHGLSETENLINAWHGRGRLGYAVTLRFAGTSTVGQMAACQKLVERYPDILFHTHLSETKTEIEWTLGLFPEFDDYLAVYEGYGMVTDHSIFAHCIHLTDSECERLMDSGAAISMCPTSNLFLGSGLVRPNRLMDYRLPLSLGTDVGGGTSFSMLQTMQELYKVARSAGDSLSAFDLFYLATLGGARALHIDQYVGSFEKGKEADFVILDSRSNSFLEHRFERTQSLEDRLFAFVFLGGASSVRETWIMGKRAHCR